MKHRRTKVEAAQDGPGREGQPVAGELDRADVARGQADAVLGFLGRMQLRLDVLSREQSEALSRIEDRLAALEQRLAQTSATTGASFPAAPDRSTPLGPAR